MLSLCFARTSCWDHAAAETCDNGFVVNGREAHPKGRNGNSPWYRWLTAGAASGISAGLTPESAACAASIPMLSSAALADPLREDAATVRRGLRTVGHRVLPGKPTGDTLQCPWTPHHMP